MKTLVLLILYAVDITGQHKATVTEVPSMEMCLEMRSTIIERSAQTVDGKLKQNSFTQNLQCMQIVVHDHYEPDYLKSLTLVKPQN